MPPVSFSIPEALNIFLATRLMLRYANRYDPNIASAFTKLNSIVPSPLKEQILSTMEWMRKLPRDDKYLRHLAKLAEAWVSKKQVRITYQALYRDETEERTIEPYFIEPAAPGHSSYVIAYCHLAKDMRTFKIERIGDVWPTAEPYTVPPGFDANAYLGYSWGIVVGGDVKEIKLKFSPEIARIMKETVWHPSQVLKPQKDGSVMMTLRVSRSEDLVAWILGWGEKVEALSPASLRGEISRTAREVMKIYRKK